MISCAVNTIKGVYSPINWEFCHILSPLVIFRAFERFSSLVQIPFPNTNCVLIRPYPSSGATVSEHKMICILT